MTFGLLIIRRIVKVVATKCQISKPRLRIFLYVTIGKIIKKMKFIPCMHIIQYTVVTVHKLLILFTLLNWLEPEADLSFIWNFFKCIYNLLLWYGHRGYDQTTSVRHRWLDGDCCDWAVLASTPNTRSSHPKRVAPPTSVSDDEGPFEVVQSKKTKRHRVESHPQQQQQRQRKRASNGGENSRDQQRRHRSTLYGKYAVVTAARNRQKKKKQFSVSTTSAQNAHRRTLSLFWALCQSTLFRVMKWNPGGDRARMSLM